MFFFVVQTIERGSQLERLFYKGSRLSTEKHECIHGTPYLHCIFRNVSSVNVFKLASVVDVYDYNPSQVHVELMCACLG